MRSPSKKRFSLISEPTKKLYQATKTMEDYNFWDFVHGYIYIRWPYYYIGIGKGDHSLAKVVIPVVNFFQRLFGKHSVSANGPLPHSLTQATGTIADGYHGKAMPSASAKELVMVNQPIQVQDLEQVIPYTRARAILQENPDHIVALECPCRRYKENPCLPMDVCLIVGEPFASFIADHHPDRSRWITQEEAATIIDEEDARGHVHHAFFKDAMMGRFYAICNCCECCCGAIQIHKSGKPMLASSGYIAQVDEALCIGCGECDPYCQFDALYINENESTAVNYDLCMGCGICVSKCAQKAISLHLDPQKGMPLEVEALVMASIPEQQ